jgi:S1-C subfamily serine protease
VNFHEILIRCDVDYMSQHIFSMPYADLAKLIYPSPRYKAFVISKRDGTPRVIEEPFKKLKRLQYSLLDYLYRNSSSPKVCVHGFIKERSILSNARAHCSSKTNYLLNVDIENFFHSITFYRIRGVFQGEPYNFSYEVSTVLAQLSTFNGRLPQGAPTSPFLSNLICRSLDGELMRLAKSHRGMYTRYADDLTFSFSVRTPLGLPENICEFDGGNLRLGNELLSIIERNSFKLNDRKSRISSRKHRLEVTGLTINEFPNVSRKYVDQIRGAIHAWDVHGYEAAQKRWVEKNSAAVKARQTRNLYAPQLKNYLWGKLLHLRMIRSSGDPIYTRLAEKYNTLCKKDSSEGFTFGPKLPIEPIVRNVNDIESAVFVLEWCGDYILNQTLPEHTEVVGAQGTAFIYKDFGLITCDHVLSSILQINGVDISIDVNSDRILNKVLYVRNPLLGKIWPVRIIHRDRHLDLAVLQFVDGVVGNRYFSSAERPILRNEQCTLVGFPNWTVGRRVNLLPVSVVIRFFRTLSHRIEISGGIRKGYSGGPLIDSSFRVIGIAQQGATQADGNDECLCITEVDKWLSELTVE